MGGQSAAKSFDDYITRLQSGLSIRPLGYFNFGVTVGCHPSQRAGIVHPKANGVSAFGQVNGQTPTDPEVAVVVDDVAKNIPLQKFGSHPRDCPQYADV